jgi:hypothetical protein
LVLLRSKAAFIRHTIYYHVVIMLMVFGVTDLTVHHNIIAVYFER